MCQPSLAAEIRGACFPVAAAVSKKGSALVVRGLPSSCSVEALVAQSKLW